MTNVEQSTIQLDTTKETSNTTVHRKQFVNIENSKYSRKSLKDSTYNFIIKD